MATSPAEALQDAHSDGREVELACTTCGECWLVHVHDGDDVTVDQAECPACPDGEGEEV
jgi:hypothetical protein